MKAESFKPIITKRSWTISDCLAHAEQAAWSAIEADRQQPTQQTKHERRLAESALGFIRRMAAQKPA